MVGHRFYERTPRQQRSAQLAVVGVLVVSMAAVVGLLLLTGALWLAVLLPLPIQIAASFIDAPSGRATGKLVYQAPLLIAERDRHGGVTLHGGTLFDYWFVFDPSMSAAERRRRVLLDYVRGLARLARAHARRGGPSYPLRATTYFVGPSTARRFGFEPAPNDGGQQLILWLNAIPITLSYSLLHGRVRLPPLRRARSYRTTIESLVDHIPQLEALERRLDASARPRNTEPIEPSR